MISICFKLGRRRRPISSKEAHWIGTRLRWAFRSTLTNGRDGGDDLTKLELVEDRGLTGSVETDHENSW